MNNFSEEDVDRPQNISVDKKTNINKLFLLEDDRDMKHSEEINQDFSLSSKPMKEIVSDIFKIYKSTYLGNKTYAHYKKDLMDKFRQQHQQEHLMEENQQEIGDTDSYINSDNTDVDVEEENDITTMPTIVSAPHPKQETKINISANKRTKLHLMKNEGSEKKYIVGPALNLSLDMSNNIVKVNLDGGSLNELVMGRWLNDNSEQGRGKKYEMVTRILPLFILPFLIQSAIVPFLVTKLKLLLMKSILVGKLAIFLLIISAFRNSNKQMQTYEVAPSYWASEPSRRSELAAAASNMAYNGYRVEGKPAAWVN
ncbi:osiris 22 isoform 2-T2 [Cochliomyia hominivorax]